MCESPLKYPWLLTVEFNRNFKLHNFQRTQVSHREQYHSKGIPFLKAETGQGHGTLQGTVTQPGKSSNFWSLLPWLYSLQSVIRYLKLGRQRLCQLYLSWCLSLWSVFLLVKARETGPHLIPLSGRKWENQDILYRSSLSWQPLWRSLHLSLAV